MSAALLRGFHHDAAISSSSQHTAVRRPRSLHLLAQQSKMANCDIGIITSCLCFIASSFTLLLGIVYIVLRLENLDVRFESCKIFTEDCNHHWRGIFSFRPNVLFDVWVPIVVGILGMSVHVLGLRFCAFFVWLLPTNYAQYAFFMCVSALFANIGYCGQGGVIVGILSGVAFLFCIIARLMGEGNIKMLQTKW